MDPILVLTLLAACGGDTPTATRTPDHAALDGAPADTTTVGRGGSYGSGH